MAWITVKPSEFAWEKGEPNATDRHRRVWHLLRFVRDVVTYENDERPHEIDITTGSLDDRSIFTEPRCFPEEKLSWVPLIDGGKS